MNSEKVSFPSICLKLISPIPGKNSGNCIFRLFEKYTIIRTIQVRSIPIYLAGKFCRTVFEKHIANVYIEKLQTKTDQLQTRNIKQNI